VSLLDKIFAFVNFIDRNHPIHIKYRLITSSITTLIALLILFLMSEDIHSSPILPYFSIFDLYRLFLSPIFSFLQICLLFLGPISIHIITAIYYHTPPSDDEEDENETENGDGGGSSKHSHLQLIISYIFTEFYPYPSYILWRNLVIAPISEEVMYRGLEWL